VIHFMLNDPSMKIIHSSVDGVAVGINPRVAQVAVAGHQAAHTRNRQAAFPTLLDLRAQGGQLGLMSTVKGMISESGRPHPAPGQK